VICRLIHLRIENRCTIDIALRAESLKPSGDSFRGLDIVEVVHDQRASLFAEPLAPAVVGTQVEAPGYASLPKLD